MVQFSLSLKAWDPRDCQHLSSHPKAQEPGAPERWCPRVGGDEYPSSKESTFALSIPFGSIQAHSSLVDSHPCWRVLPSIWASLSPVMEIRGYIVFPAPILALLRKPHQSIETVFWRSHSRLWTQGPVSSYHSIMYMFPYSSKPRTFVSTKTLFCSHFQISPGLSLLQFHSGV